MAFDTQESLLIGHLLSVFSLLHLQMVRTDSTNRHVKRSSFWSWSQVYWRIDLSSISSHTGHNQCSTYQHFDRNNYIEWWLLEVCTTSIWHIYSSLASYFSYYLYWCSNILLCPSKNCRFVPFYQPCLRLLRCCYNAGSWMSWELSTH